MEFNLEIDIPRTVIHCWKKHLKVNKIQEITKAWKRNQSILKLILISKYEKSSVNV